MLKEKKIDDLTKRQIFLFQVNYGILTALGVLVIIAVLLLWSSIGQGASYYTGIVQQIMDMNGLKAGRDVLLPNGELWHVDEVTVQVQDTGPNKLTVLPKIITHRIRQNAPPPVKE